MFAGLGGGGGSILGLGLRGFVVELVEGWTAESSCVNVYQRRFLVNSFGFGKI